MAIREKLEAQFHRANISTRDFEEAECYLRAYKSRFSNPIKRAVLVAAIVAYARPFTQNKEGQHRKATASLAVSPNKILTETERQLHHKVIALRHEAVAHSDFDRKPTRRIFSTSRGFVTQAKLFDVLGERINIQAFQSIAAKMNKHCVDTMFRLNRELSF
jgi:hypothetical protein